MKKILSTVTVVLAALSFTAVAFAADAVKPIVPVIDTTGVSSTAAGIQKDSIAAKTKAKADAAAKANAANEAKAKAKADATAKAKAAIAAKEKAKTDATAKAKAAKEAKAKLKSDAAAKAKETKVKANADANALKNSFVPVVK